MINSDYLFKIEALFYKRQLEDATSYSDFNR